MNAFFDFLNHILSSLSAATIATPRESFFTARAGETGLELLKRMKDKNLNYDIIPIENDDSGIVGFVSQCEVRKHPEVDVTHSLETLTLNNLVDETTPLNIILRVLGEQEYKFVFTLREDFVSGIVTEADLEKHPMRILFYSIISRLEALLATIVGDAVITGHFNKDINNLRRYIRTGADEVGERYNRAKKSGSELDVEYYLDFSHFKRIILGIPQLRNELGLGSYRDARKLLNDMNTLRNSVVHPHNIITKCRGAKELKLLYNQITGLITRCESVVTQNSE